MEEILNQIKEILTKNNLSLSTAESCTGGLLSSYLTDIDGASKFIYQNFVTYANAAKHKYLGVSNETLDTYGAVSEQTAYEMSKGLLDLADSSIATTGILGPKGASEDKPLGLVYISFGLKKDDKKIIKVIRYISPKDNRKARKTDIVEYALKQYLENIKILLQP